MFYLLLIFLFIGIIATIFYVCEWEGKRNTIIVLILIIVDGADEGGREAVFLIAGLYFRDLLRDDRLG